MGERAGAGSRAGGAVVRGRPVRLPESRSFAGRVDWDIPAAAGFVILVQDLPYADFLERGAVLADRILYPLWVRRIPVCLFSWLGSEVYQSRPIRGDDLHSDFARGVRALLAEPVARLLERSNYQIASPALLEPEASGIFFTPVEDKLRLALEAGGLSYRPQARLGRQEVDFLVSVQNKQVAVECESKAWHETSQAGESDKPLSLAGVPLCRFSAAEIEAGRG